VSLFDQIRHQTVGLRDAFPRIVDERRLNGVPSSTQPRQLVVGKKACLAGRFESLVGRNDLIGICGLRWFALEQGRLTGGGIEVVDLHRSFVRRHALASCEVPDC
jgi:hypothetical protein